MSDCKILCGEGEELPQTQSSETDTDLKEETTSGPENEYIFDVSRKNLKEFPTYLYVKCLYIKVRCNKGS